MKSSRYLLLLTVIAINISCKKNFLETPPQNLIVRQSYITNIQSCSDYLNGIYVDISSNFYHGYLSLYPDLIADNIKPSGSVYNAHYTWTQIADESRTLNGGSSDKNMNGLWTSGYKIIRSCNYLIENIDRFRSENPDKANEIKGQCLGIRALVHFQLVSVFGQPFIYSSGASHLGVPYVTISDYTQPVTRATVGEVYRSILTDLKEALELLPTTQSSNLYFTTGAAKALLARVHLFKGDYVASKNFAREIINGYPLLTGSNYLSKLFTPQETEAVFQLLPSANGVNSASHITSFQGQFFKGATVQFFATNDISIILNERPNDSRKAWVSILSGNWNINKFPSNIIAGFPNINGSYYQTVFRSSEMYLTASESYAKIGIEDSARFFLDAIRKRADPAIPPISATGTSLLDSIYKERRKELCFEGLRMFDLLRLEKGVTRNDGASGSTSLPYPSNKAIAPIHLLDVKSYRIQQNLEY